MSRWSIALLGAALSCVAAAGCKCCSRNSCGPSRAPCNTCAPGPVPAPMSGLPGAPVPAPPGSLPPAGGTFAPPPPPTGATFTPPPPSGPYTPPAPAPAPASPPAGVSGYGPTAVAPAESNWHGVPNGGVRLYAPEASSAEPPRESVRLQTPAPMPSGPAVSEDRSTSPAMPADIPQFAAVRDRITSGLKPFPDGFSWLKSNGYRTVLHLRQPGEVDSADRRVVENHGLRFLSLEVSSQTLPQSSEEFNRVVSDPTALPLFVYDRDGLLAGAMWYLHFRTVERLPEEASRQKAAALGLKEDSRGEYGTMWVAIQDYLRKLAR